MTSLKKKIRFHSHQFSLEFTCGMTIVYPMDWFPSQANAGIEDLKRCKVKEGEILWPTLSFKFSLEDLVQKHWGFPLFKGHSENLEELIQKHWDFLLFKGHSENLGELIQKHWDSAIFKEHSENKEDKHD